ncbi:MAG TPA: hypothetical protein VGG28_05205 [Kofleriaceae bacterium]
MLAGLLGLHHEATTAHVVDPTTGEIRHASARQLGRHTGTHSDYHAVSSQDGGGDVCPISTALHQAVETPHAHATIVAAQPVTRSEAVAPPTTTVTRDVLHVAPKTSPPALV